MILNSTYRVLNKAQPEPRDWTKFSFDDSSWTYSPLGRKELKNLVGYDSQPGLVLQRVKLKVPKPLFDFEQPIAFYVPYISFSRYQVFINSQQISDDLGLIYPFCIGVISIPRSSVDTNLEVVISIRGQFTPGDLGLVYKSMSLIGVKSDFKDVYVEGERSDNTYYNVI